MKHYYIINRLEEAVPEKVGAKAWNLFLLKDKFSIPEFAVINTEAFNYYHLHKTISPEIEEQIRDILESLLKKGTVAIRSSGIAEDLSSATFAGMYKTFLGIRDTESGIKAVINIWE